MRRNGSKLKSMSFVLVLVFIMVSLLSACSSSGSSGSGNQASGNASPSLSTGDSAQSTGDVSAAPMELSIFVDHTWWPHKDWSGKIPEAITKATGVKLNVTVATDSKQLPLMLASGDLPDLVFTSDWKRMSDPKISNAWSDLISKYVPNMEVDPIRVALNTVGDGKYYTIRSFYSTPQEWQDHQPYALLMGPDLSVRKDILEELGNPPINSFDDLLNLFGMVKKKYPDMTPLVLNPFWTNQFFAMNYGAITSNFYDNNGKLEYYLRQPKLLKTYEFINQLYREGYVTAENFAYKDEAQTQQMMLDGKGFAYTWASGGADTLKAASQKYEFVNIAEPLSPDMEYYDTSSGWSGLFVTNNNKHLQETMNFIQFLYSEKGQQLMLWGIEGEDWDMDPKGYPVLNYDSHNVDLVTKMGVGRWNLVGSAVYEQLRSYNPDSEGTKAGQVLMKYTKFNPALSLVVPDQETDQFVIKNNIDNMVKNEITKVYLAKTKEAADKAYQDMIAKADKIGMKDLEAWANQEYPAIQARIAKAEGQ